ncbi:MAG: imelysin family protein [Ekhidna sp.]|uniref:imelysin family protein n=1 Tax=Ekhidna sp. TaxID=2608089 RepID=UPI0032F06D28
MRVLKVVYLIICTTLFVACSGDESVSSSDGFDRQAMLENWADNIMVPGYEAYVSSLGTLKASTEVFTESPSIENLNSLRDAWLDAYLAWQRVAMFEIGKAEELTLINYTNIYPLGVEDMIQTIEGGDYDLTSVNRQDEQGFPAIEYLIYAVRDTDQEIVNLYSQEMANHPYKIYLIDLVERLEFMGSDVLTDWKSGYRDTFVGKDGSDATSSVNKVVNDYIFYYEKHLRAGKIGIPAGVFSASTFSDKVEGRFSGKSKVLFDAALNAMQDFFNGKAFNSNLPVEGIGLNDYLDYLNTIKDGDDLSTLVNDQFDRARAAATELGENFGEQVETDNSKMLATYDELQMNVVYLKVDMAQAMSIGITYVDADGD